MSETKELRNKIISLKKLLQSAPKSDHSQIKQEIEKLEEELEILRKGPKPQTEDSKLQTEIKTQDFKPSKSFLKKQKKQAEVEIQRQEALKSLQNSHSKIISEEEGMDLAKRLSEASLKVYEIPSDGNCLFAAVQHQLSLVNVKFSSSELRNVAVQTIRNNREEFSAFLAEETLEDYCQRMSQSGEWGGEMELVALSKALNKPIRVFQAFIHPFLIDKTG